MKDFYVRTKTHWAKVMRYPNKDFYICIGYAGNFTAYRGARYSHEFMPTIRDAREHARYVVDNP